MWTRDNPDRCSFAFEKDDRIPVKQSLGGRTKGIFRPPANKQRMTSQSRHPTIRRLHTPCGSIQPGHLGPSFSDLRQHLSFRLFLILLGDDNWLSGGLSSSHSLNRRFSGCFARIAQPRLKLPSLNKRKTNPGLHWSDA